MPLSHCNCPFVFWNFCCRLAISGAGCVSGSTEIMWLVGFTGITHELNLNCLNFNINTTFNVSLFGKANKPTKFI